MDKNAQCQRPLVVVACSIGRNLYIKVGPRFPKRVSVILASSYHSDQSIWVQLVIQRNSLTDSRALLAIGSEGVWAGTPYRAGSGRVSDICHILGESGNMLSIFLIQLYDTHTHTHTFVSLAPSLCFVCP